MPEAEGRLHRLRKLTQSDRAILVAKTASATAAVLIGIRGIETVRKLEPQYRTAREPIVAEILRQLKDTKITGETSEWAAQYGQQLIKLANHQGDIDIKALSIALNKLADFTEGLRYPETRKEIIDILRGTIYKGISPLDTEALLVLVPSVGDLLLHYAHASLREHLKNKVIALLLYKAQRQLLDNMCKKINNPSQVLYLQ